MAVDIGKLFQSGWDAVDDQVVDIASQYIQKKLKLAPKPPSQVTYQYASPQVAPVNYTRIGLIAILGLLIFWLIYRKWLL